MAMNNKFWRVITLYADIDIHMRLQEENIFISCQINVHKREAWSLYISFQNHNSQAGTGKFIYRPSRLDEKQTGSTEKP